MTLHNVFCIIKENVHLTGGPKVVGRRLINGSYHMGAQISMVTLRGRFVTPLVVLLLRKK
jgi:hypothetical protein